MSTTKTKSPAEPATSPVTKPAAASPKGDPAAKRAARTGAARAGARKLVDAATSQAAFGELAVHLLDPDAYTNPRGDFDQVGEAFAELAASIAELGLIEPIAIGPAADGRHPVLAGWRRLAAAQAAGKTTVPVHVLTDVVDAKRALEVGLAENIARQDMSPLAEARALHALIEQHGHTQISAGKLVGLAERTVRERLRLLKLHQAVPEVGAAIDDGTVPMDSAVNLQRVAECSPALAAAAVELVTHGSDSLHQGELEDWGWTPGGLAKTETLAEVIDSVVSDATVTGIYPVGHGGQLSVDPPLTPEQRERHRKVPPLETWQHDPPSFHLTDEELDEARKCGALLEIKIDGAYRNQTRTYVTDEEFLRALIEPKLVIMEAAGVKRTIAREAARKKAAVESGKTGAHGLTPAEVKKAKDEKAKESRAREVAHHRNVALGARLTHELAGELALSLPGAKLLARLLLSDDEHALMSRGPRYCDPEHVTEEVRKNGTVKRAYAVADYSSLRHLVDTAETPAEALGPVLRAMLLSLHSDQQVVAQSNRAHWSLPWHRGDEPDPFQTRVDELVEASNLLDGLDEEATQRADSYQPAGKPLAEALGEVLGKQSRAVYEAVEAKPGITIPELATELGVRQNQLYRLVPDLINKGVLRKEGRGLHTQPQGEK